MPGKELVTESCVRRLTPGSRLVLGPHKIATPAALDLAFQLGVEVVFGPGDAGSTAVNSGTTAASGLWERIKACEGTFVVEIKGGRAVVTQLGASGPVRFGEET